jgi:hypothetical protein
MKLAIISTTIYGEKGYLKYDQLAKKSKFDKVSFFIAGDKKSLPFDTSKFKNKIEYLTPKDQNKYASSEAIGWGKPARRNIALLRAMESDPDFILTIDDDNEPSEDYFDLWYRVITNPVHKHVVGIKEIEHPHWHNYLGPSNAEIEIYTRGFPIPFRYKNSTKVVDAPKSIPADQVGVFQGITLGDPDIDAKTRIVYSKRMPLTSIGEKNYALKDIWSPYNSQNTIFSKKLFPLAFMWSTAGRSEDIYASYVWQRFLFNNDMYSHVGDAVNFSDRGVRSNLRDFALEIETYMKSHEVWEEINKIKEKDALSFIDALIHSNYEVIARERGFMHAFRTDLERIFNKLSIKKPAKKAPKKQIGGRRQVSSRGHHKLPNQKKSLNRKGR